MNRRHFLAAAAGIGAAGVSSAEETKDVFDWKKVVEKTHFTAACSQAEDGSYPDIRLEVALEQPEPDSPGSRRIKKFELTWNQSVVPIEKRFWNDMEAHWVIQTYPATELKKERPNFEHYKLLQEVENLKQPRLSLSADKGTVLIEWRRPEECDSYSCVRWIVSKSGMVLRHRYTPYHEC